MSESGNDRTGRLIRPSSFRESGRRGDYRLAANRSRPLHSAEPLSREADAESIVTTTAGDDLPLCERRRRRRAMSLATEVLLPESSADPGQDVRPSLPSSAAEVLESYSKFCRELGVIVHRIGGIAFKTLAQGIELRLSFAHVVESRTLEHV